MDLLDLTKEPAIQLRLSPGWSLGATADGCRLAARDGQGREIELAEYNPHHENANRHLALGAPLAALRALIPAAAGPQAAIAWLVLLRDWCRRGLIEFPLVDDDAERAVIVPQWSGHFPALAAEEPPAESGLHRFAYLRDDDGVWLLESPLCPVRVRLAGLSALKAPLVRRALAAAGFFDHGDAGEHAARRGALKQWEFHDLLFHVRHRAGWHFDQVGAAFPFIDQFDPPPALRPSWPGETIDLSSAEHDAEKESFARISRRRKSARSYDETRPIRLSEIGALLDRCARVRSTDSQMVHGDGAAVAMEFAYRPYPGGGACYELEIYLLVDRCDGLDSGAYHYDAGRHRLTRIRDRTAEVEEMISQAKMGAGNQARPQVLLVISARFSRVMWKYRSIAYSLILRNTGALYHALYLAATELGLAPCALGTGDSALFARLTGLDPLVEGSVGEFMLGGRPLEQNSDKI